jgi:hypothetical protein
MLFRGRGRKRCLAEGRQRLELFVGAAVLANNLMRLANNKTRMHDVVDKLSVRLLTDPPGVLEVPGTPNPFIVIYVGRSVYISCDRSGRRHRGLSVHGDIDIVPQACPVGGR